MMQPLRADRGSLQRLLRAGILLAAPAVAGAAELFDFARAFDPAQQAARGVTIAVTDGALDIIGTVPASDRGVVLALPEQGRHLARFRCVGTNPGRPWRPAGGAGWNNVGLGWDERAARMRGCRWFAAPANRGAQVHFDVGYVADRPSTVATRR